MRGAWRGPLTAAGRRPDHRGVTVGLPARRSRLRVAAARVSSVEDLQRNFMDGASDRHWPGWFVRRLEGKLTANAMRAPRRLLKVSPEPAPSEAQRQYAVRSRVSR